MGEKMMPPQESFISPFNGPVEIGLRAISILNDAFPSAYSLQRIVIFDYLSVHSDDISGGPEGLHPQTPHRNGELLVRRNVVQKGLLLYMARGLAVQKFRLNGIVYAATEKTGSFLDVLQSEYIFELRKRTRWLVETFSDMDDDHLNTFICKHLGAWGAEFEMESVLWEENEI